MHKDIQGASTISQQYVKNVCVQQAEAIIDAKKSTAAYKLCIDKSYNRKIREMRLDIGQAATLISIVNNPDAFRLDIKKNLAGAEGRRNYVLGVERSHGMITA